MCLLVLWELLLVAEGGDVRIMCAGSASVDGLGAPLHSVAANWFGAHAAHVTVSDWFLYQLS